MIELTETEKAIIKKYGDCIKPASFIDEVDQEVYSIGPRLDRALSGGVPSRSLMILSGKKKIGKTTTALQIAKSFQDKERPVVYCDFEYRWKKVNAYAIQGFDPSKVRLVRSEERSPGKDSKVLSAEDKLQIATTLMKMPEFYGSLFIIDSLSALCPEDVINSGNVSGSRRSSSPKLIADWLKQIAPYIQINNLTVICISHLIANTSGYGSPFMEDGGNYVQYQSDIHIRSMKNQKLIVEEDNVVGQSIIWDVPVSALGPPAENVESFIRYGYGIDKIAETLEDAIDLGVVMKGGAWLSYGEHKVQGKLKFRNFLEDNPEVLTEISKEIDSIYAL